MPSLVVLVIAIVLAISSVLVALIAISRRQYDPSAPATNSSTDDRPPGSGGRPTPTALAPVLSLCLDEATRIRAHNSSEAAAVAAVRTALDLAVDGAFAIEICDLLDGIEGIEVLTDVREMGVAGAAIDHLVVAPRGVVIVDSVVRSAKVTVEREAVLVGPVRGARRELTVDEIVEQMSSIAEMVETVPVNGVIVFEDVLTLPDEIREGTAQVNGVRLMISSGLATFLAEPGELEEVALVAALLRARFRPALSAPGPELDPTRLLPAPGPPPIPPTSTANRVSRSTPGSPPASTSPQASTSTVAAPAVSPSMNGNGLRPGGVAGS